MRRPSSWWGRILVVAGVLWGAAPAAVEAQADVIVVNGRIEDAETETPLEGAIVIAGDASGGVAVTDAQGLFALPMSSGSTYVLEAELFGYEPMEFELGSGAPAQLSVLRLHPLSSGEGLTVVDDRGFVTLVDRLDTRREGYRAPVRTYGRAELDPFGGATIRDFLARVLPDAGPCQGVPQLLCRPGRYDRSDEVDPVLVCLDESIAARGAVDLETLPMSSVARVELYAPESGWGLVGNPFRGGQVRIYTTRWMINRSAQNPHSLRPLRTGC